MDNIVDIIVKALPDFIDNLISRADIILTATPAWGQAAIATSTFIILAVGAYYALTHTGVVRNPFGGGEIDDDNW